MMCYIFQCKCAAKIKSTTHLAHCSHFGLGPPDVAVGVIHLHCKKNLSFIVLPTQDIDHSIQLSNTKVLSGLHRQRESTIAQM